MGRETLSSNPETVSHDNALNFIATIQSKYPLYLTEEGVQSIVNDENEYIDDLDEFAKNLEEEGHSVDNIIAVRHNPSGKILTIIYENPGTLEPYEYKISPNDPNRSDLANVYYGIFGLELKKPSRTEKKDKNNIKFDGTIKAHNVKVDLHKARKKAKKEAEKIATRELERRDRTTGSRADAMKASVEAIFESAIDGINKRWERVIETAESYRDAKEKIKVLEKEMMDMGKQLKGFVESMTSEELNMTYESLVRMHKMAAKVTEVISEPKYEVLREAFLWAIGAPSPRFKGRSVSAREGIAFVAIESQFNQDPTLQNEASTVAWMILSIVDSKKRMKFVEDYLGINMGTGEHAATHDPAYLKEFAIMGNKFGAFTVEEMEKILPPDHALTDEEKEKYAYIWDQQKNFPKMVEQLKRGGSYGSANAAGSMLTIGNVVIFLGKIAAAVTLGANIAVGAFSEGHFNSPGQFLENTFTNEYVYGAGLLLGTLSVMGGEKRFMELLEGERAERHSQINLYKFVHSKPDWNDGILKDNAGVYSDYLNKKAIKGGKIDKTRVDPQSFIKYLKEQEKAKAEGKHTDRENVDYRKLKETVIAMKANGKITETDMGELADMFVDLKIGGKTAQQTYEKSKTKGETLG